METLLVSTSKIVDLVSSEEKTKAFKKSNLLAENLLKEFGTSAVLRKFFSSPYSCPVKPHEIKGTIIKYLARTVVDAKVSNTITSLKLCSCIDIETRQQLTTLLSSSEFLLTATWRDVHDSTFLDLNA
jgi:hypothetical protein